MCKNKLHQFCHFSDEVLNNSSERSEDVLLNEAKNLVDIKDDVYVDVPEILHSTSFRSE